MRGNHHDTTTQRGAVVSWWVMSPSAGNGSKLLWLEVQQQVVEKTQGLASLKAKLIRAEAAIAATEQRRRQAEQQFRAEALPGSVAVMKEEKSHSDPGFGLSAVQRPAHLTMR